MPLVGRAVDSTDGAAFLPRSYTAARLAALRRLRRDAGLPERAAAERTPQDIDAGVRFFRDGTAMVARDLRRGRLLAYGDGAAVYGRFALLALSTFPLTPLLIPIIDKRRRDGTQSDYVPTAYRARRLDAFARLRARESLDEK